MANGQAVLSSVVLDTAEVERLHGRLESRELARHADHAAQLTDALALDREYRAVGMELQTTAELALLWRCSENLAGARLYEAQVLDRLGALAVMRTGLLTVEQGRVVVDILGKVEDDLALSVWLRLEHRLEQDARSNVRAGYGEFATSVPGVFAAGDVRFGSVKPVAGAVGEGSVAVGSVHEYLAGLDTRDRRPSGSDR